MEHVVLECEKYERDRMEMMQVILTELGHRLDERVEKTGRDGGGGGDVRCLWRVR